MVENTNPDNTRLELLLRRLSNLPGITDIALVSDAADIPIGNLTRISARQFRQLLGREFDAVCFDMFSGFHADAFVALSGCIRGGGIYLLHAPPVETWREFSDPDLDRLLAYPAKRQDSANCFLGFLQHEFAHASCWSAGGFQEFVAFCSTPNQRTQGNAGSFAANLDDQKQIIAAVLANWRGRSDIAIVSAPRGRGKSSALGIISARVQRQTNRPFPNAPAVWVTAPNKAACGTLFKHYHLELQALSGNRNASECHSLKFIAPDALLQLIVNPEINSKQKLPDLLIIDEAAAIPLYLLLEFLQAIPNCILSSTTEGYEGSGQGFRLRFLPELQRAGHRLQSFSLQAPVRWAQGDPLDLFFSKTFLLATENAGNRTPSNSPPAASLQLQRLESKALVEQPAVLEELFGLLTMAHYRTTPDDLRILLDCPEVQVFAVFHDARLYGCILVSMEQPFSDNALEAAIWQGARRPKGHLLQQSLAQQLHIRQGLSTTMARIVRIAIHPNWQRQGMGSWALKQLFETLPDDITLVGTSFAAESQVLRFWRRQGFQLVRLGTKRDPYSGCYPALMFKARESLGETLVAKAQRRFLQRIQFDLARARYPAVHHSLLTGRELKSAQHLKIDVSAIGQVSEEIGLFAAGYRNYYAVEDSLHLARKLKPNFAGNSAWRECIEHHCDLAEAAQRLSLPGKKQVIAALRNAAACWLASFPAMR